MRFVVAALAMALASSAAVAGQPDGVSVGEAVTHPSGAAVGTVAEVTEGSLIIDTGTLRAAVPASSFARWDGSLVVDMTREEIHESAASIAAERRARLDELLAVGADVLSSDGGKIGTVEAVESDFVAVTIGEVSARMPLAAFAPGEGGVVVSMSAAELASAVTETPPAIGQSELTAAVVGAAGDPPASGQEEPEVAVDVLAAGPASPESPTPATEISAAEPR